MAVIQKRGAGEREAASNTVPKSRLPKTFEMAKMPMNMPRSPMRVTMNAFLPAAAADGRKNQKEISR